MSNKLYYGEYSDFSEGEEVWVFYSENGERLYPNAKVVMGKTDVIYVDGSEVSFTGYDLKFISAPIDKPQVNSWDKYINEYGNFQAYFINKAHGLTLIHSRVNCSEERSEKYEALRDFLLHEYPLKEETELKHYPISEYPRDKSSIVLLFSDSWSNPSVGFYLRVTSKFYPAHRGVDDTYDGQKFQSDYITQPTHFAYIGE